VVTFLEQVALVESEYSQGEKTGRSRDGVRLMTMHQAKGLEFLYVFVVGLEEGILPHSRSIEDQFQLEEERRLFYVAITRAMRKLYLTHARRRFIFGRRSESLKSRFIRTEADEAQEDYW
jgi:DNA helicase-2/ATP-dependent DNA helicase PcrA